jgi:hypothetical protein
LLSIFQRLDFFFLQPRSNIFASIYKMPSLKSLISAIALACLASGETIKITATSSNTFDPSTVTAADGDILEFHFEPKNHSVVSGLYAFPCSPTQLGTGFFSGFSFDTSSGEAVCGP